MKTEYEPDSYERFLLVGRVYCERCVNLTEAVRVLNPHENPEAVCEKHWQEAEPVKPEST